MSRARLWLLGALLVLGLASPAAGAVYLNCGTTEPTINAAATTLHCDDFERNAAGGTPGTWYTLNADQQPANSASQKGWGGTIFADSYIPVATLCGNQGAVGTNCTANSGALPGPNPDNTGNQAFHAFAPSATGYTTIYLRRYTKYSANHTSGPEKYISFNNFSAGVGITVAGWGAGAGPWAMCPVQDCNGSINNAQNLPFPNGCPGGVAYYLCPNILPKLDFNSVRGHWIAEQVRITLNTSGQQNGIFQMWLDDCGTNGLGCTGTPTMRSNFTNVRWIPSGTNLVLSYFMENQSPPTDPTQGSELYDQIVVATAGPIPFMGTSAPSVFNILATAGTYTATGAAATVTQAAGPTLIGFVHRAALVLIIIFAILALRRLRHAAR